MTTTTAPVADSAVRPHRAPSGVGERLRWAISDTATIANRNLTAEERKMYFDGWDTLVTCVP